MFIDIKKIEKNYKTITDPLNKTVGSVFKHYRRKSGLTQEEVSNGICSLSYLCKIERNQINPSEDKVINIAKKLNIPLSELSVEDKDIVWIEKVLLEEYVNEDIVNELSSGFSHQSKLVAYAVAILNNRNYSNAGKLNRDLSDYFASFNQAEMEFYSYLTMIYLHENERYNEVVSLFEMINKTSLNNNLILNSLTVVFSALYYLDRNSEIIMLIKEKIKLFYQNNRLSLIERIKKIELKVLAKTAKLSDLEFELSLIYDKEIDKNYLWFLYYYHNKEDYFKALNYIKEVKDLNQRNYLEYLVTLNKTKNYELLITHLEKPNLEFTVKSYQKLFLILKNYHLKEADVCNDRSVIHFDKITSDFFVLSTVYEILLTDAKYRYSYKRSVEILEKENKLLKEKATIIYK